MPIQNDWIFMLQIFRRHRVQCCSSPSLHALFQESSDSPQCHGLLAEKDRAYIARHHLPIHDTSCFRMSAAGEALVRSFCTHSQAEEWPNRFRISGFPEFQKSDSRKSRFSRIRTYGFSGFRTSESPEIRISGNLKIPIFCFPGHWM